MGVLIGRDNPVEVEKKTTSYGAETIVAATESKVEVSEDVEDEKPQVSVESPVEKPVAKRRAKRRGRNELQR